MKNYFQNIHYKKIKPNPVLNMGLCLAELFYKFAINIKNFLYKTNILSEKSVDANVICVGNLTTGGVGKTPIVINIANELSHFGPVAVISRGYKAKISNKNPNVIKDFDEIKFPDGTLCADEPYQTAKKTNNNVIVITCKNRLKAAKFAIEKYGIKTIILDDGFSNRKLKKDKTYIVIDSKMRFGNEHILPKGPLREPISELERADEIILVNKGDKDINFAIDWAKSFKKPIRICEVAPKRIYNINTKAQVNITKKQDAIAFCAIGQSEQFFDFAKEYYNLKEKIAFVDHHKYTKTDIKKLSNLAQKHKTSIFITTQKDETKLKELIRKSNLSFNVLELDTVIK